MQISTVRSCVRRDTIYATVRGAQTKLNRYNGFLTRYTARLLYIVFVIDEYCVCYYKIQYEFAIIAPEIIGKTWVCTNI